MTNDMPSSFSGSPLPAISVAVKRSLIHLQSEVDAAVLLKAASDFPRLKTRDRSVGVRQEKGSVRHDNGSYYALERII